MASSSAGSKNALAIKKDELYERCAQQPSDTLFYQEDLAGFGVADDVSQLMQLVQELISSKLLQVLTYDHTTCYRIRSREEAQKFLSMSQDELILYGHIEQAHTAGIWTKALNAKTNLHAATVTKCLKSLEHKNFVKTIKSVKFPTRKIYMLAGLMPGEDVTGGPWFSDGELDVDFIEIIADMVVNYVRKQSWVEHKVPVKRKDAADKEAGKPAKKEKQRYIVNLVPHPPGYRQYPTASTVLNYLISSEVLADTTLSLSDLQHLLDVLVYDGRLERMGAVGYRAARDSQHPHDLEHLDPGQDYEEAKGERTNGLSEAPCGRCPVFVLCEEGGPVNAENCVYFEEWLKS